MSKYKTLNETVRNGTFYDAVAYVVESRKPNELFDALEGKRMSILHLFSSDGATSHVEFLLSINANPNVLDSDGETPLHYAAERGQKEIVRLLLDNGAKLNVQANDGDTPLHRALIERQNEIAKVLVNKGADVNIANNRGISPKQISAFNILK